ncbi:hypothetical protein Hdeb2414_s0027g00695241 [Helianthus debilis subsp. tardiflorus]
METYQYLRLLDELSTTDCIISVNITSSLLDYARPIYQSEREKKYSEPMIWIGLYIACASLVCILAMVADLLHGIRRGCWVNRFCLQVTGRHVIGSRGSWSQTSSRVTGLTRLRVK